MKYDFSEISGKVQNIVEKVTIDAKKYGGEAKKYGSEALENAKSKASEFASNISEPGHFNIPDQYKNAYMLKGRLARNGYDWWWHSFTGRDAETGEEKGFFVEYFMINPAFGGTEPVFGQLPENKANGVKPSYMMVKAGAWGDGHAQLHRFFGWDDVKISDEVPFELEAGDCICNEGRIAGSVTVSEEERQDHPEWMSDAGSMRWNLSVDKQVAFNVGYGTSTALRSAKAFEMYWHAEGMKTEFAGYVEFNGRKYIVSPENSYGYADKNWGYDFTSPWIWLTSNNLISNTTGKKLENSVFDIGGGKPCLTSGTQYSDEIKLGDVVTVHKPVDIRVEIKDKLLGALYYEGQEIEFNFTKAWTKPATKFNCKETEDEIIWHVEQENRTHVMQTNIHCKKKDMILVAYEAPDGSKRHNRLWNGGNGEGWIRLYEKKDDERILIDVINARNVGCEWGKFDE